MRLWESTRVRKIGLLFLFLSSTLALWAFVIEPAMLTVSTFRLKLPHWHQEHDGLRVAALADLHVGAPHQSLEKLDSIVEKVNSLRPDLVLILGDLVIHGVVGGSFVPPEPIAERLKHLKSSLGTFAVLGNHDWWYDGNRVTKALKDVGITVLENDVRRLEHNRKTFSLEGIADIWTQTPDIPGSISRVEGEDSILLITHNPDIFPEVPGRVSLTLAGHTHGGQVNLPLIGRPIVPSQFGQRFAMGHIVEDGRHLFVSGGVGTSILPVRFRVIPEVAFLTLFHQER